MSELDTTEGVNFADYLRVLRRRLPVLALCVVLVPAAAVGFSLTQQKKYTASASLLFRDPQFGQTLFGSNVLPASSDATRQAATDLTLVNERVVADRTAKALGNGLTGDEVAGEVSASAKGESNVVSVNATDRSPERAARIANTFADQFIAFRRDSDRAKIEQGETLLRRDYDRLSPREQRGTRGRGLEREIQNLQALASLQTGNAELVQPADVPTSPSSPKTLRNGLLGLVLGILLGVGAAFLYERLDRRLREPDEVRATFGRPLLCTIPQSRAIAGAGADPNRLSPVDAEAFRMLRANLRYFDVDSDVKSVLVTSPAAGDGKTTVAWNLACAAAGAGANVLLIEADMRNPTLGRYLGLAEAAGLSELLSGHATFEDAVQQVQVHERTNGADSSRTMDFVTAGHVPPNPTELVESRRMRDLIRESESRYDLVVLDTPPAAVVSDAVPLIGEVSGVIVVSRLGMTTRDSASRLRDQLANLNAPTLGVVVNGGPTRSGYAYYGYGQRNGKAPRARVRG